MTRGLNLVALPEFSLIIAFHDRCEEFLVRPGNDRILGVVDVGAAWCGLFRPFGLLLAVLFSRRLQQLNVPLSGLDTSKGLTTEVLQLIDPATGLPQHTAWFRRLRGSGNVLYAGFYFTVHGDSGTVWARYVRALRESIHVFPAENGLLRADHVLTYFGATFLRLHYRMRRQPR